jgi:hypothetical protein
MGIKRRDEKMNANRSELEVSKYGRPIVWLATWKWYGGKSGGFCVFATFKEAMKYAICQAMGDADWENFPDPARGSYPDDDRDGSDTPDLTPKFRVSWDGNGGGYSQVERCEVSGKFNWAADYLQKRVEEIYRSIVERESTGAMSACPGRESTSNCGHSKGSGW